MNSTDEIPDGPANSGNTEEDIRDCYVDKESVTIQGFIHPTTGQFVARTLHDDMGESEFLLKTKFISEFQKIFYFNPFFSLPDSTRSSSHL